jgi:hypothetical protein
VTTDELLLLRLRLLRLRLRLAEESVPAAAAAALVWGHKQFLIYIINKFIK